MFLDHFKNYLEAQSPTRLWDSKQSINHELLQNQKQIA